MITDKIEGKTVKSVHWGVLDYGCTHEVLKIEFTDGDEFWIRSTTGYEDSGFEEVMRKEMGEVTWNDKD
jgi:hypothetical protein